MMDKVWDHVDMPGVEDLLAYIANRERILRKVLLDHSSWERSHQAFGREASLAMTWIDHEGGQQIVAINRVYLAAHWKIAHSLLMDLFSLGDEGMHVIKRAINMKDSLIDDGTVG